MIDYVNGKKVRIGLNDLIVEEDGVERVIKEDDPMRREYDLKRIDNALKGAEIKIREFLAKKRMSLKDNEISKELNELFEYLETHFLETIKINAVELYEKDKKTDAIIYVNIVDNILRYLPSTKKKLIDKLERRFLQSFS